jgi:hypothetical protein
MDRDDHDRNAHQCAGARGRGRLRKQALAPDGLEGVRRQIALEVALEMIEEFTGRRPSTRELLDELLTRLREGD